MASSVTLHEAQEKLAELLDRAESGEEIVIEREGRAAVRIVPVASTAPRKEPRIGGQNLLGVTYIAPDFDDPMTLGYEKDLATASRTLAECIAMLPEDSNATADEDFAQDVEAAIAMHQ